MIEIKILPRMQTPFSEKDTKCEMKVVVDPAWRGRNKRLKKACASFAKLYIDGVPMCLKHAQITALKILLSEANERSKAKHGR